MKQAKYGIYEWLDHIRERPGMYIGKHRIIQLHAHLGGFMSGIETNGLYSFECPPFDLFHEWIAYKFGWTTSASGWCDIILEENSNDEIKALDHFFVLYDEFRNLKIESIQKGKIRKENRAFHTSARCTIKRINPKNTQDTLPLYSHPKEVFIINFRNFGFFYAVKSDHGMEFDFSIHESNEKNIQQRMRELFGENIEYSHLKGDMKKVFEKILKKRKVHNEWKILLKK